MSVLNLSAVLTVRDPQVRQPILLPDVAGVIVTGYMYRKAQTALSSGQLPRESVIYLEAGGWAPENGDGSFFVKARGGRHTLARTFQTARNDAGKVEPFEIGTLRQPVGVLFAFSLELNFRAGTMDYDVYPRAGAAAPSTDEIAGVLPVGNMAAKRWVLELGLAKSKGQESTSVGTKAQVLVEAIEPGEAWPGPVWPELDRELFGLDDPVDPPIDPPARGLSSLASYMVAHMLAIHADPTASAPGHPDADVEANVARAVAYGRALDRQLPNLAEDD